jgi:hypothetical protein
MKNGLRQQSRKYLYKISNLLRYRNSFPTYAAGGIEIVDLFTILVLTSYWFFKYNFVTLGIIFLLLFHADFSSCLNIPPPKEKLNKCNQYIKN